MEEQQKTEEKKEEKQEEKKEEKKAETKLDETIAEIKQGYEHKISELVKENNKQLKERDDVIKQLLFQENKQKTEMTIADKINANRAFKW